jgi:hypothetical protein
MHVFAHFLLPSYTYLELRRRRACRPGIIPMAESMESRSFVWRKESSRNLKNLLKKVVCILDMFVKQFQTMDFARLGVCISYIMMVQ